MDGETDGFVPPEFSEGQEQPDSSRENLGGVGGEEAQKGPLWREKVLEGMSQEDQEAVRRMRSFFEENGPGQKWYYSGAGGDISPTLIAPSDTEHWWVDPRYDASSRFYIVTGVNGGLVEDISNPYKTLGALVKEAVPWDQAWQRGRQTLVVDDRTTIEMVGGGTQEKETAPEDIDVIYTNPISTFPGPEALINLKAGGYVVSVELEGPGRGLDLYLLKYPIDGGNSRQANLHDFGWRHIGAEEVTKWDFPAAGGTIGSITDEKLTFNIHEKTRELTPEEKDILRLDSVAFFMEHTHKGLIGTGHGNVTPEFRKIYEEEYRSAVRGYLEVMNNLKGNSKELAGSIQDYVEEEMELGRGYPEHERAKEIFEEERARV